MIDPSSPRSPALPVRSGVTPTAAPTPSAPASFGADSLAPTAGKAALTLNPEAPGLRIPLPPILDPIFGPRGPKLLHLDARWTPQGQGHDPERGELLTTYYRDRDVLLSIQDQDDGREAVQVVLGGKGGVPGPSHGGGVSTDGERVYVADTDRIYVYDRADLAGAAQRGERAIPLHVTTVPPDTTDPVTGIPLISNGSFMTVKDGFAYVGSYSPDGDGKVGAVWRYALDRESGALREDSRQGPIRAPDRAQGIEVVDGGLLFTTGDRKLMYQPYDAAAFTADIGRRVDIGAGRIDSYPQGFNIVGDELWVTYESGSYKYRDKVLLPREHIQRIPLTSLDLEAAGLKPSDLQG